jgi:hypothetical protein
MSSGTTQLRRITRFAYLERMGGNNARRDQKSPSHQGVAENAMRDGTTKSGKPMTVRLLRAMSAHETRERNALTTKDEGLALAAGTVVTVVETFDKGSAFLVEFTKSGKAKKDSCDWMGVVKPTEVEIVDIAVTK